MKEQYWHITLASEGRRALFTSESVLRSTVRTLARIAGQLMLLFCVVDEHVHLVLRCDRRMAGVLGRSIRMALNPLASAPIESARIRPVESRSHLERLVSYVLGQPSHHGLGTHPALWTGSCFLDLVGGRAIPGLELKLYQALPRLRVSDVLSAVGLPMRVLAPFDDKQLRAAGAAALVRGAAVVLGTGPCLLGRGAEVVATRALAVGLAKSVGLATSELAFVLNVSPRTVQKLAYQTIDPSIFGAVRMYLAVEAAVELTQSARGVEMGGGTVLPVR